MKNNKEWALVTGATSGIGLELSKLLARDGYNLVIVARSEEELQATATLLREQDITVVTLSKDLFDMEQARSVFGEVTAQGISIDILVNDAGQGYYGEFVDNDLKRELDIIHLNICSLVILTKQFLQPMVANGKGRILNLASIAGKMPGPLQAVYHGTKAFVHSFSEAIREELKDSGVTVTSLLPGATDTDFFNKADMQDAKIVVEGKLGDAATVAKDGYEAMMAGKDMVVSGFMNKVQVAMSNITPDSTVAAQMHEQQKPVNEDKKDEELSKE